jgi:hypothetical protein
MATVATASEMDNQEYKRPDAAKAFEIYDKQIKPKLTKIDTARGELSQPWQDIKEHANFPRPVMNFLIALENIEDEAKRDHFLLALSGGLEHRKLFLPRDLVTMAGGEDGGPVVPSAERAPFKLVGVDDQGDSFEEATEEELAAQKPRAEDAEAKALKKSSVTVNPAAALAGEELPPAA